MTKRTNQQDIYNVTRLNREVRSVLEGSFPEIRVQGEISNLAQPASGHVYLSLKDKNSQVRCAMFKGRNRNLRFDLKNGLEVIIRANVSLYEGRGEFQLIIESMEPAGEGALQKAFEELKLRLHNEGLFDNAHKSPLPDFPRKIGVITSPTGAAIRDILHVLKRRYPLAGVIIYPVPVQGEGAAAKISRSLALADSRKECDVFILARGGGSLEDLWAFNEEALARTIFELKTPLVSGVGHEIDFTIADFVADHRAPTPSAAAEESSPNMHDLVVSVTSHQNQIVKLINYMVVEKLQLLGQLKKRLPHPARDLQNISQRLDDISSHMLNQLRLNASQKKTEVTRLYGQLNKFSPVQQLKLYTQKNNFLLTQLEDKTIKTLTEMRTKLGQLGHSLDVTSPLATIDRGYAIVSNENNMIVRDPNILEIGEQITTRLSKGNIKSKVTKIEN